jgi:hypothetical protein
MPEGSNIMSASDLMLTFLSHTSANDVKYIGGLNPFTIKVDGEEVFIYIKNLSPAQLSNNNPDIWRILLPMRDDFEKIKESSSPFILLGYDKDNDVYTTWNPYWCKQRLNVGKSVSLYSRLSLQQRVHENDKIEQLPLNNDGDVVCLPGNKIYEYIKNFKTYYPDETLSLQGIQVFRQNCVRPKRRTNYIRHLLILMLMRMVIKSFWKVQVEQRVP